MKFAPVIKIKREDLKDAPPWINYLIDPLNGFMESVYQALSSNITFQDNVLSFVKEITYDTPSTYPSGVANITFINTLKVRAIGVVVAQAYVKNAYTPVAGPVYVPWIESNGNIVVSTITGLSASTSYTIRLLVF